MTTRTSAYTVTTSVWGHEGQSHTDPYPQRDGDYYGYPTTPRVDHYPSSGHWEEPTTGQHGSFEQVTTSKQKNTYHKRANYSQDSRHQQNEEYRQNDQNGPYSEEDAHNEQDPRYEAISPFDYPTSPPELSTSPSISSGSSIATLDAQFQGSYFTDVRRPVNVKSRDAGLAYLGSSFDNMHISPGYSTRVEVGSYDDDGLIGSDETLGQAEWCATTGPLPTSTQVSDPYGNAYADQQEYYEETPDNEDELAISDEVDALFADAENTVTKRDWKAVGPRPAVAKSIASAVRLLRDSERINEKAVAAALSAARKARSGGRSSSSKQTHHKSRSHKHSTSQRKKY